MDVTITVGIIPSAAAYRTHVPWVREHLWWLDWPHEFESDHNSHILTAWHTATFITFVCTSKFIWIPEPPVLALPQSCIRFMCNTKTGHKLKGSRYVSYIFGCFLFNISLIMSLMDIKAVVLRPALFKGPLCVTQRVLLPLHVLTVSTSFSWLGDQLHTYNLSVLYVCLKEQFTHK